MKFTLYPDVQDFYSNLVAALSLAERSITMMYYEFLAGVWAADISRILMEKQAAGVTVRLLVDEFGLIELTPLQAIRNRLLIKELSASGIQVQLFRPKQTRTSYFNRLHCKLCAIDGQILFIGGSNIADDYLNMQDLNLKAEGNIEPTIEKLFEYLVCPVNTDSVAADMKPAAPAILPKLFIENTRLVLTLPGHRQDLRRSLLGLILDANESIHISTWIFLPDREIVNALLHQIESGCRVNILLSDRTRVRFIDIANQVIIHKLVRAGAQVWRYAPRYMHAKACWNEEGTILFGSANLDSKALNSNYECSLLFKDQTIAKQLREKFEQDVKRSYPITAETFSSKHWSNKGFAYLGLAAASWL